jgi:hypothetical protein
MTRITLDIPDDDRLSSDKRIRTHALAPDGPDRLTRRSPVERAQQQQVGRDGRPRRMREQRGEEIEAWFSAHARIQIRIQQAESAQFSSTYAPLGRSVGPVPTFGCSAAHLQSIRKPNESVGENENVNVPAQLTTGLPSAVDPYRPFPGQLRNEWYSNELALLSAVIQLVCWSSSSELSVVTVCA